MGHTLFSVLGFFLLNLLLYCGHAQDPVLTFEPNWSTFFMGESLTFTCDMREGKDTDWYYTFMNDGQEFLSYNTEKKYTLQPLYTGYSGQYQCFGNHKTGQYRSKGSNKVSLTVSDKDVILEYPASTVYEGESVTLRCRHRTQIKEAASFYKDGSLIETHTNLQSPIRSENTAEITIQPGSDGSFYKCKFEEDEESESIQLNVDSNRPKAKLSRDDAVSPAGGNVTLTCSVIPPSSGWTYFWYRGMKTSEPLTKQDAVFISSDKILVSPGGLYWCRGGRGNPVYYTEYSDAVVTNRAVVNLRPDWPEIYRGDTITLTCEIEDGGDTEWEYEWTLPWPYTPPKHKEYKITYALSSYTGDYRCQGKMKNGQSTKWSEAFILKVSDNVPQPVLTVSPLWLSPGDSVTLNCEVKHLSSGWRFYFYKALPKLSQNYYSFEFLPESSNGTEQDSYIVHGQNHTAAYTCRAGRGNPVSYSALKFVWSGDFHSAASLTVSPDRVQHFIQESVLLSCKGNSTKWRVRGFSKSGYFFTCSDWGTVIGSTCNTQSSHDGVFWCESETGQFSNAVNISRTYTDVILVSPVHPVAEGDSVTLVCKFKTENVSPIVDFYKNSELIQNDSRRELMIPAVSKSDEGFYKCKGKDLRQVSYTSSQSWLSVKSCVQCTETDPKNFSLPVMWIVGPVCAVFLIIFLLLFLCYYTKSKDSCFIRSQSTNQGSATDHMINQDQTQSKNSASPIQDSCLYESIKDPEAVENDESNDVTYSLIELKNITKKGKTIEPEESAVYSDVRKRSVADSSLIYAQVCSRSKANKDKRKPSPSAEDGTVYSEVKPRTALDQ